MTLALAKPKQSFRILRLVVEEDSALGIRLRQLGFVEGVSCECLTVAPLVRSPFLILIRGMRVALTRDEAALVQVQEVAL